MNGKRIAALLFVIVSGAAPILAAVKTDTVIVSHSATGAEIKQVETADPGCMKAQVFKNLHHYGKQEYAAIVFI